MYFLAHCWELFFTFYLAVRLVWPKIRVDFFLPCTWASEKLSHGWQSIIFFSSTWVFSNVGPQFAVKLCFFLLGRPISGKTGSHYFASMPLGLSYQACKIHKIIWFCLGYIYYPGLTFAQWATNKYMFCKTLGWVHGLELPWWHFPLKCRKHMGTVWFGKYCCCYQGIHCILKMVT